VSAELKVSCIHWPNDKKGPEIVFRDEHGIAYSYRVGEDNSADCAIGCAVENSEKDRYYVQSEAKQKAAALVAQFDKMIDDIKRACEEFKKGRAA
jgi:hypothetical protein